MAIDRVIALQHNHNFQKFVSFLEVLEVYGTGYSEDVHYKLYRVRDKETHTTSTINALEKVVRMVMISKFQITNRTYIFSKALEERLAALLDYL